MPQALQTMSRDLNDDVAEQQLTRQCPDGQMVTGQFVIGQFRADNSWQTVYRGQLKYINFNYSTCDPPCQK